MMIQKSFIFSLLCSLGFIGNVVASEELDKYSQEETERICESDELLFVLGLKMSWQKFWNVKMLSILFIVVSGYNLLRIFIWRTKAFSFTFFVKELYKAMNLGDSEIGRNRFIQLLKSFLWKSLLRLSIIAFMVYFVELIARTALEFSNNTIWESIKQIFSYFIEDIMSWMRALLLVVGMLVAVFAGLFVLPFRVFSKLLGFYLMLLGAYLIYKGLRSLGFRFKILLGVIFIYLCFFRSGTLLINMKIIYKSNLHWLAFFQYFDPYFFVGTRRDDVMMKKIVYVLFMSLSCYFSILYGLSCNRIYEVQQAIDREVYLSYRRRAIKKRNLLPRK